jgi:AcrR family transcriptional regulator
LHIGVQVSTMASMTIESPRTLRRDAADNRVALISAARIALNQDPDASLETIAAAAGLSRRAVYGHFATRESLVSEVVALGVARVASALTTVRHPDPLVRLALIAGELWREVENVRVMAIFAVRGPLTDIVTDALRPLRARVFESVREGARAGTIRSDIDPVVLARLVESAAIAVLDESNRSPIDSATGRELAMLAVLGAAGLSWRDAHLLIDSTPELGTDN